MSRVILRKSSFLWLVAVTSLITFVFLRQVQLTLKPLSFEKHKFWLYDLEQEEPLQSDQKCQLPRIHPFDQSILGYLSPTRTIKCKERQHSFTFIDEQGVLRLNETTLKVNQYQVEDIICNYQEITRNDDFSVNYGENTPLSVNGSTVNSDFVYVSCTDSSGFALYSNVHCHVVPGTKWEIHSKTRTKYSTAYNILIIGIDSLSRQSFIRQLPETYEFLTKKLNALVFRGMTKIGDNTFPNVVAMLTGKSVINNELPRVDTPTGTYDEWPFLWKNFSSAKYATMYAEDQPKIGLFNYHRGGMVNQPTDHYMRPFWLAVETSKLLVLSSSLCFGNIPKHILMLNYTRSFMQKYDKNKTPFFAFSFFVELSHDYVRLVSSADEDFKSWLSDLFHSGYLNNTFLFFLSDHGHRFDSMRATLIGRIEERMPFFSVVVPQSLYKSHPHVIDSLKTNVRRLITPYDVYFSILDLLNHGIKATELGSIASQRGTTIFAPITNNRTCETAGIPDHYCVCEREEILEVSDPRSQKAATVLLSDINNLVQYSHGNFCAELSLIEIVRSDLIIPPREVIVNSRLYFGKLKEDNRAKGMLGKLRLIIKTTPGNAMFEATLQFREDDESFSVLGDISRINQYGRQSDCIEEAVLKKYCYCKSLIK